MFQQVPMVEMDGMKLVQTRAILNYIATKYNLYGKDIKERALIDMYTEGMADLNEMFIVVPLCPPDQKDAKIALIKERTTDRYLPVFEKVLKSHGQDYLVGNTLSRADIHLVELLYYVEELDPSLLANFPLLKVISLTAFRREGSHLPPQDLTFGLWFHLVMPRTFEVDASPRRIDCLHQEKDPGLSINLPIPIPLWFLSLFSLGFPSSRCILRVSA
uniref:glutathione S-transferase A2 isoform X3 n=1 Tax=Halichoerus grypus TaxID=9711 RepID=UPI001659EBA5|nr:glutathione S-transferase A2 isoform X3 [Halichoerus grypus]